MFNLLFLNLIIFSQEGWCDRKGTVDDIKTKLQQRQDGAFKRERALAYALAQKVTNSFNFIHLIFMNLNF